MKRFALALMMAMAGAAPAVAQQFTSPEDLLSSLYYAYLSGQGVDNLEPYFSDRLTEEMQGGRLDAQAVQRLGFDPMTGTTDPGLITLFNLESPGSGALTAEAVATFNNDNVPVWIEFSLVYEDIHGWQIDHIAGKAGDVSWCSKDLVAAVRDSAAR